MHLPCANRIYNFALYSGRRKILRLYIIVKIEILTKYQENSNPSITIHQQKNVHFFKSPLERGRYGFERWQGCVLQRSIAARTKHTPPPLSRGESRKPRFLSLLFYPKILNSLKSQKAAPCPCSFVQKSFIQKSFIQKINSFSPALSGYTQNDSCQIQRQTVHHFQSFLCR